MLLLETVILCLDLVLQVETQLVLLLQRQTNLIVQSQMDYQMFLSRLMFRTGLHFSIQSSYPQQKIHFHNHEKNLGKLLRYQLFLMNVISTYNDLKGKLAYRKGFNMTYLNRLYTQRTSYQGFILIELIRKYRCKALHKE